MNRTVQPAAVCRAANLAARAIWALASDGTHSSTGIPADLQVNCTLVAELLQCLTQGLRCGLADSIMGVAIPKDLVLSYYSGVWQPSGQVLYARARKLSVCALMTP